MENSKYCLHCAQPLPEFSSVCPHCGKNDQPMDVYPDALPFRTVLKDRYTTGPVLIHDDIGFIYQALDCQTGWLCSVRELFPEDLCTRDSLGRVIPNPQQEALFTRVLNRSRRQSQIYAMLNKNSSDSIAQLLDSFEANGTILLVFPHQESTILTNYVSCNNTLTAAETFSLFLPVAQTLSRLHSFGVIHGGIHPARLSRLPNGEILLPDFRCEGLGVPDAYTPALQVDSDCIPDYWVDTYAIAGCLYFCLTGSDPLTGDDSIKKMLRQLRRIPGLDQQFLNAFSLARIPGNADSLDTLIQAMKHTARNSRPLMWVLLSSASCILMILTFFLGGSSAVPVLNDPSWESTQASAPMDQTEPVSLTSAFMTPGSYLLENYADPSLIMGIEGGYCDNGARLILTSHDPANYNRILVTDHDPNDGFYNLQAAHTNSFLSAGIVGQAGDVMSQYFSMRDLDSEKWIFVPSGQDQGRTVYTLVDAGGRTLAPEGGNAVKGSEIVLTPYDEADPTQKWLLVWSERDTDQSSITVLQPGEPFPAPDDPSAVTFGSDAWCLSDDGKLILADTAGSISLRFYPLPDGGYRLATYDESSCLEYLPAENHLILSEPSDTRNQCFHLIYGGFGTCQIRTDDGLLLYVDVSDHLIRGSDETQFRDMTIFTLQSK